MSNQPRCLVINLDRRQDRWQGFMDRNGHMPLSFHRISGIDGQTLDFPSLITSGFIPPHAPHRQYTKGSIGIALTFQRLWQQIAEGNEPVVIFEDDVALSPDITAHIAMAADMLAQNQCDLFYFGYNFNTPIAIETLHGFKGLIKLGEQAPANAAFIRKFQHQPPQPHQTMIARIMHAWGMCAMMVSPDGAKKLLSLCFPLPDEQQQLFLFGQERHIPPIGIDSMVNLRLQQMDLRALGMFPPSAITPNDQADSDSISR